MNRRRFLGAAGAAGAALAGSGVLAAPAIAQRRGAMAEAAIRWLESLDGPRLADALDPFGDGTRTDWHYVPRSRPGLTLKRMSAGQRTLAWALIASGLSEAGLRKARGVITLETILHERSGGSSFRDPENYAVLINGDPRRAGPWAWWFEGHHLSLHFTVVPGQGVAVTPAFIGTNPARVGGSHHSHAGLRVLADEHDLPFALLRGFDPAQRRRAVIATDAPGDIVTGPGREDSLKAPAGLPFGALSGRQQAAARKILDLYLGNMSDAIARRQWRRIREAGVDRLHFAWAGSQTPGAPHYYRIHGPTVIVEYDNTQNGANHAHSVWHDPTDRFGADLLKRHHMNDHK